MVSFKNKRRIPTVNRALDGVNLAQRLTAIAIALSIEQDLDRLLETLLLEAKSIANADGGTLYYRTDDNQLEFAIIRTDSLKLAFGGTTGIKAPLPPLHLINPETGEANLGVQAVFAVLNKQTVNIADAYDAFGFDFKGTRRFDTEHNYRTQSVITVPMINHKEEAMGCLQLINAKDPVTGEISPFSPEVQRVVEALASQAAVILENKRLIEAQENLLESFIRVLAKAIDAKSPYTGSHCERVPVLTEMLAAAGCAADYGIFQDFNLDEAKKYELHVAAWLHDCGKISTPVHIMDKATKLETIFDRIELLRTRWEVLKRDAQIAHLQALAQPGADREALEKRYQQEVRTMDEEIAFLQHINIGSEFMDPEKFERLYQIATRKWVHEGKEQSVLTENELYNLSIRRGTITAEERQIMNDHMIHTCNMLEELPFPKHLQQVPEYACGHHERMDGKGYPKGIEAGTMSIPARMMAVADVFEALTAGDRPYKRAKKLSEAMNIIAEMKRTNHLDPDIVDLFVKSGVYRAYAEQFLDRTLIDAVDENAILAIKPEPRTG